MAKPLFVLADTNLEYIAPLEAKLLETFRDGIDLEVMDDPAYMEQFASNARRIDVLIVADRLYSAFLRQNDIGIVYKLAEEESDENLQGSSVRVIYKYAHIQKVFGEIEYGARPFVQTKRVQVQKTKIVLVYSASGGVGKTTIALGLSTNLAGNHKRVLYLDAENIQDFGYYLQDKNSLVASANAILGGAGGDLYNGIKPYIKSEGFDYLPPLRMAASAMGIDCSIYVQMAKEFQKHVDYDYIIIDTDSVFDSSKDEMMQMADKIILVTSTTAAARYKTELLMNNLAAVDSGRFLTVCSRGGDGMAMGSDAVVGNMVGPITLAAMQKNRDMEKLSYLI